MSIDTVELTILPATVTGPSTDASVDSYEQAAALMVVDSDEAYAEAGEIAIGLKALETEIVDFFKPMKQRAHEAHAAICRAESDKLGKIRQIIATLKQKADVYQRERRRMADEAAAAARAALERQERERREAEARQLEAEATAQPAQAVELHEAAAAVRSEPVFVPAAAVEPAPLPKVSGLAHKESWDAEVTDLFELIRHVAAHSEHELLILPNLTALRQMAKSLRSKMNIPGVRAYDKGGVSISARGRR